MNQRSCSSRVQARCAFRNGDRQVVAFPNLTQQNRRADRSTIADTHGFQVGVGVAAVVPVRPARVSSQSFVQKALAGDVVVDANHVRRAWVVEEPGEL